MICKINTDKNRVVGKIKPMHCTNNVPSFNDDVLLETVKEAGIPYARLHDSWMALYDRFVDIPKIFPDFDADETQAESYDFAFTDELMKAMAKAGVKPFYRLGTSIENYQAIKPYFIYPPKDFKKWARICEHVIMHYNKGWANGFYYNIEYWEIWNEPENYPDVCDNQEWKGTIQEFYELYTITSKYLKGKFPELKIGGYGSCGFYAVLEQKSNPNAKVSERTGYFIDFFKDFLSYIKKESAPLDFFSWHSYSDVKSNVEYAEYARKTLDEYGFCDTEHMLNEWNPGIMNRGTLRDSADIAANMLALQNSTLSMLMYYDTKPTSTYCGLYNPLYAGLPVEKEKKVFKAYYIFKAFNELYSLKNQVALSGLEKDVYAVAAYDGKTGKIMLANDSDSEKEFLIEGNVKVCGLKILSETENFTEISASSSFKLKPFESVLIKFE